MNKDFQLANKAYEVETNILYAIAQNTLDGKCIETEQNIAIMNNEGVSRLGVKFENGIELIGANYNKTTGTTVILCRDTNTGEILASCTGTNFIKGIPSEIAKDVNNWFDIASYGMSPYGEEVNSVIDFFNQMGVYPSRISGHSLGGSVAQLVGLRLNIDIEVYNSAPLYVTDTNFISSLVNHVGEAWENKGLSSEEVIRRKAELTNRMEKNKEAIDSLRSRYTGNCVNYTNAQDILTGLSKRHGGQYAGECIEVTKTDLREEDKLLTSAHVPSNMAAHQGFMDDKDIHNHKLQGLDGFVNDESIEIDIEHDGVVDITKTSNDYKHRNLFKSPQQWYDYTDSISISINPDNLSNLSASLGVISDQLIANDLGIVQKIIDKNNVIANNKQQRIYESGEQIKEYIYSDILHNSICEVKDLLESKVDTLGSLKIHRLVTKINNIYASNFLSFGSTNYASAYDSTLSTRTSEYDALRQRIGEVNKQQNLLTNNLVPESKKSAKQAISLIKDFQNKVNDIFLMLEELLADSSSNFANNLRDYVCSMFNELTTFLIGDLDTIKLLLSKSSEIIDIINTNFVDKDSNDAKSLYDNILRSIQPYRIDASDFVQIKEKGDSANEKYIQFKDFDDQYDNHLDNCLQKIRLQYINPIGNALYDIATQVSKCDDKILDTISTIDALFENMIEPYNVNGGQSTLNEEYFDNLFTNIEDGACKVSSSYYIQDYNNLCSYYCSLKEISDTFCQKTHYFTMPLFTEGIQNYLLNMIMSAFYKSLDYDEQVAAINMISYDLTLLSSDLNVVIVALREQKSVALDALVSILEEINDYCKVFNARIDMIFGEQSNKLKSNKEIHKQKKIKDDIIHFDPVRRPMKFLKDIFST